MKYSPKIYARSFCEVLKKTSSFKQQEKIVNNFVKVVVKYDDHHRFNQILDEIRKLLIKERGGKNILLEFARKIPQQVEQLIKNCFSEKDFVNVRINRFLVGGVRVVVDEEKELDYTVRKIIKELLFQQ